ncbi:GGDEF domain-containing protein [Methylobacter sp. Wu8]|uniref:Diguanylate cyclase/phosphodiesterase n=1 Tax=Methylobacter tundripaludum TaxID=173365 RepID=A0A2S6H6V1_9GAMM|nr:GGDEF domain-containing protein [Methylobacter tundripaludum]MCK9635074.1 GGDEF domain-containing protein [Methylobacter tundripaludum]PPK73126.1 diguanylate cyclase/phosphodiesterase [Methylobacter tundripaludum]
MPDLRKEIINILDGKLLTPHFQPIVSLTHKKILGYEALIRGPSNSPLHSPFNLFTTAERFNLSTKLEFLCREITIQRYADLDIKEKLFINASPLVLLQPEFKKGETLRLLDQYGVNPRSVVIELTEHKPADNYEIMRASAKHYRGMGFEIALDDLGAGYSGLRLWAELLPEYVKIDKHFVHSLHNDPIKLNFVRSIQSMAVSLNCSVIAEGIETQEEFKAIEKIGITNAQGYYFARPTAVPVKEIDKALFAIEQDTDCKSAPFNNATTAVQIIRDITPISAKTTISDVMNLFHHNSELTILPLVDDNIASGIIFRDKFLTKLFSSRYGIDLHGKNPIKMFIENTPLCIDKNMPIDLVSKQLTSLMTNDPAFIITHNGEYMGVGTLLDLLAEFTRQQIDNAKHANPLTLLPGSVPINNQINQLLANKIPFGFGYFDLDNFKPFNDVYSYDAGDAIIKAVANTLIQYIPAESGRVGHIGGDDFIVIFTCDDWLTRCKNILKAFESTVPSHYSDKDINAGGIHTENRAGEKCFFPLISLSVGLVDPVSTSQCQSHVDIADLASEAKKMAKKIPGNSLFINQRMAAKNSGNFQSFTHSATKLHIVN